MLIKSLFECVLVAFLCRFRIFGWFRCRRRRRRCIFTFNISISLERVQDNNQIDCHYGSDDRAGRNRERVEFVFGE